MKKENKEQLKELLGTLYSQADVEKIAETIEAGEKLIRDYPVLEPAETTKWRIKAAIAKQLRARKQRVLRTRVYQALGAVAVIIIMLTVSVNILNKGPIPPGPGPEGESIFTAMDARTSAFSQEIDQIERQFTALQYGQSGDEQLNSVDELETQYIMLASDFWKGE